ncbi:2TM domain-containing protein [Aridibaculum aurantiacum]|uniref:2TM domain-containing protein n=1 Tax=Aridibaculum aurantiacum TaxID=2810307 RepID=UPI001A96140C|nr:2TM domain-containing protein [Aridibaculum aurantiacum]
METTTKQTTSANHADDLRRDDVLWQMAKRRAGFKYSLLAYIFVNLFLIATWYFTSGSHSYFWPVWPMLGWGIGLAFQYFGAYHGDNVFSAEKEYEKMKRSNEK